MSASSNESPRALMRGLLPWVAALFVVLVIIYAFSVDMRATRGASITGDEPFYLMTTKSLLADRDLDLRNQYQARSYEEFFDHPDGLWRQSVPSGDGRLLSPHNPGLSVLVIPGFVLGGLIGVQAQLVLIAAAAFSLAFVLTDRLTRRRTASWLVTLGVAVGAVAFTHSTEIYPEFPAALALVLGLLVATAQPRPGLFAALWLVVLLSAMCWLGVKYAPLALLVAGFFLLRADRRGRIGLLSLGLISAAIFVWFHMRTFGGLTPYAVNLVYAGQSTAELLDAHIDFNDRLYRLWGLFVDQRFGIGRWVPILLVVVPGLVLLAKAGSTQRLVLGLIAAQMLIATFVAITMMGWWFAGRTLVTVLPLMVLPLTLLALSAPTGVRAAVAALGVYGASITAGLAYAAYTGEITIAVDPFEMRYLPFRGLSWLFPDYRSWTMETWALTALWLVAAVMSVLAAYRMASGAVAVPQRAIGCTPQEPADLQDDGESNLSGLDGRRMVATAGASSSASVQGGESS